MIDLHYWTTPNGHKITIFLEETGLPYRLKPVNISAGEQFDPAFLAISPNNRIPAIVDHDPPGGGAPITLFESGAILLYLAGKTGRFYPTDLRGRCEVMQWLFWQMAGLGPMAGQNHHFNLYAPEKIPYAIERYVKETGRLYGVLNKRLGDREFVAGEYSIADMACYPVDLARAAGAGHEPLPASRALEGRDRGAPGGRARLRDREDDQRQAVRDATTSRAPCCSGRTVRRCAEANLPRPDRRPLDHLVARWCPGGLLARRLTVSVSSRRGSPSMVTGSSTCR